MPSVDLNRWALYAEPQSKGKNWCWAAALSSIARYRLENKFMNQGDFVYCGIAEAKTEQPAWNEYLMMMNAIQQKGLMVMGSSGKLAKVSFQFNMQMGFDLAMIRGEMGHGRPVIVTVKHPQKDMSHDLVIIAIDYRADVSALKYWNPEDGEIGEYSIDGFQRDFSPGVTTAVMISS
jgi:hypothetical protein